ncbi:MAG: hypothetical protein JW904_11200 [Spirochaetales bacterium]|nr:hypothetical protein [Spirochaetales bacterium]
MDVVIFTNSVSIQKHMRTKGFYSLPTSEIRKALAQYSGPVIVYIDIESIGEKWEKTVSSIARRQHVFLGLLDPKKKIKRPLDLIHAGVVDIAIHKEIEEEFGVRRIRKVTNYLKKFRLDFSAEAEHEKKIAAKSIEYIPVAGGWQDIHPGKEYTFSIMFVEMDDEQEILKKFGKRNLESALEVFRRYIERNITAFGGRMWMWSQFGGVILFPFNANESNAVLCGFRIMLYKFMHDVEESYFPNFISFRVALHLGNLAYQEENTGDVIADSINSIFHLGRKYTEPGNFDVTEEIFNYSPVKLKSFFKRVGEFESHSILRMKRPVL